MDIAPEKDDKQVIAPSSGATDDKTASSAGQRSDDTTSQTLLDVVEKAAAASVAAHKGEEKFDPTLGSDQKPAAEAAPNTAKEEPSVNGKTVTPSDKLDTDGKEIPPFNEHPRWKEVTSERNTLRDKVSEYERDWKPLVARQQGIVDYCSQNNISPEQFQQALEVAALINTNPREALKRIQPVIDGLKQYDESALPQDLEKRVVDNDLDIDTAREIAALRAQAKSQEHGGNVLRQKTEQAAYQQRMRALLGWEQSMMSKDPDFKPKVKQDEVDGKYETMVNNFRGLLAQFPPRNEAELVTLLQHAYDSVNKMFTARLSPRVATGKLVPASGSSTTIQEKEPETLEEVIFATAAKHGPIH